MPKASLYMDGKGALRSYCQPCHIWAFHSLRFHSRCDERPWDITIPGSGLAPFFSPHGVCTLFKQGSKNGPSAYSSSHVKCHLPLTRRGRRTWLSPKMETKEPIPMHTFRCIFLQKDPASKRAQEPPKLQRQTYHLSSICPFFCLGVCIGD